VRVNGEILRKPHQVIDDPTHRLELLQRAPTTLDCGAGWLIHPRVSLLYIDSAVAVVNKGPGLISVPAPNTELSALSILQDFLSGRLKARDRAIPGRALPHAFRRLALLPVHRLDQYTSGVFCMGCNAAARTHLIQQLKARTMKREYVAFVQGQPKGQKGTWRQWMKLSEDKMRQRFVPDQSAGASPGSAAEAVTHYEVLAEYRVAQTGGFVAKLRLQLETGLKHQIRFQAASSGLPLIGDRTYNPAYRPGSVQPARLEFSRQALHAERLTLEHPELPEKQMSWTAELPPDLRELEARLNAISAQDKAKKVVAP
jgi:23S rRNA pseudouridine1911/1915/1917 synthase